MEHHVLLGAVLQGALRQLVEPGPATPGAAGLVDVAVTGSPTLGGGRYFGTMTCTLTEYNTNGTVKCSKTGTSQVILLIYSYPVSYCSIF